MTPSYREDIDWLRAIAVLSVLAFHWDVPGFVGGYVGVDVFFVISGFLITGIIQSEMAAGTFTFARFYERRIRRLLPALYVTVAVSAVPVFYLLFPFERLEFFKSAAATVAFVANIFFWNQSGYFDREAVEKPLLHTWSLSVEEQFYLVLPFLIWALVRWQRNKPDARAALLLGISAFALVSFGYGLWLMQNEKAASAFFLSPPRAWEFLLGSLLALPGLPAIRNIHLYRVMRYFGLVMIAIAVFAYRRKVSFPGVSALLPCVGAMLFIWSGQGSGAPLRGRYSPLRLLSFFGKISYSLYLWHWPIFVYARLSQIDLQLRPLHKIVLFMLAVALSYASYRLIEQPVRKRAMLPTARGAFAFAGVGAVLLLSGVAVGIANSSGLSSQDASIRKLESYTSYVPLFRTDQCFMHDWIGFDEKTCLDTGGDAGKTSALIFGDSLAAHYYHGLSKVTDPQRVRVLQATAESCMPSLVVLSVAYARCNDMARFIEPYLRDHRPDVVILSADWISYRLRMGFDSMVDEIKRVADELKVRGIRVVLVGPNIQFRGSAPLIALRIAARHVDPVPLQDLVIPDIFTLDDQMKAVLSGLSGLTYVSILDDVCPERRCPILVGDGAPLTFDHAHLTGEGSEFLAPYIAKAAGLPLAASAN